MSEHEAPPKELAELFAAEKAAPVADAAVRAAAKSRLVAAVGHVPLGQAAAAAASTLAGAGKVIAVIALTVGIGGGTVALVKHGTGTRASAPVMERVPVVEVGAHEPRSPEASTQASSTQASNTQASSTLPEQPTVEATAPAVGPAAASAPSVAPTVRAPARLAKRQPGAVHEDHEDKVAPAHDDGPSEVHLLRGAWAALNANKGAEALELVRDDERLHRDGVLAEERQALTVLALAQLGRLADARVASSAFIARYPTSVHRARVERAVSIEEIP
jgi:hypothetical protein